MKIALSVLALLSLCGCQIGYIVKSGYYQMKLLSKRERFDKALADPRIDEETKRKIRLVQEVKKFAEDKLHLTHSRNYETFVLLDDKYVVYAITASYKDRLEPYLWNFPIVGKVPYKGFFNKEDAEQEKKNLEKMDLDVENRGVAAYSTLGWFRDPLLSSMTRYEDVDLVETIIHETTHATAYIKSNADFNERLATFVGAKGLEAFYATKEGERSVSINKAQTNAADSKTFSDFISGEIKRLETFYSSNKNSPTLLQDREKQFELIQKNFATSCKPLLKGHSYSGFEDVKLNNAVLLSYKTYYNDLTIFDRVFNKFGGDWTRFINFFYNMRHSKNPEQEVTQFLAQ